MSKKDKTIILCTAGPPCHYLCMGNQGECSFDGICKFQRPLVDISQQPNAADGDRSWACPNCGGVHDNIDEYYKFCQFCGYPRR